MTLPSLQLDRAKFEICLFPLKTTGGALEDYCRSLADEFIPLPAELDAQVATIHHAELALLRELDIPELIASDEPSYIRISVKLATDPDFRRQIGERILDRMARSPRFIDSPAYGKQLGDLIERLCSGGKMKRAVVPPATHR